MSPLGAADARAVIVQAPSVCNRMRRLTKCLFTAEAQRAQRKKTAPEMRSFLCPLRPLRLCGESISPGALSTGETPSHTTACHTTGVYVLADSRRRVCTLSSTFMKLM
jgi:hypothetical protein